MRNRFRVLLTHLPEPVFLLPATLLTEFSMDLYPTLKALHIIAVISWMAGMLYLPRLYVYHATALPGGEASEMLKIMERKLLRYIMNPAMILTYFFGVLLVFKINALDPASGGWFHAKFLLVLVMTGIHGMLAKQRRAFAEDRNTKSARYFRLLNEVPTVLLILIVFLVVLKPF